MTQIKVGGSFSGKISTGSYENAAPGFYAEVIIETNGKSVDVQNEYIRLKQIELNRICYDNFKAVEQKMIIERITKERQSFRFRKQPNGKLAPSVTSIINYDADFHGISEEDLNQYAAQSSITHCQFSKFHETGKVLAPKDIEKCLTHLIILFNGKLKLKPIEFNFAGFFERHPFKVRSWDKVVHNEKEEYSGELDYEGWSVETVGNVPSICDVKRTADPVKAFMQMAAYVKCGMDDIKQMMIIPVGTGTKQGFSKPIVSTEIEKYYVAFLDKRKAFRRRYGV